MEKKAIILNKKDNVATCMHGADIGDNVHCTGEKEQLVVCKSKIPDCNKVALTEFKKDDLVIKYGEVIGAATENINIGCLVSDANIRSLPRDYSSEML